MRLEIKILFLFLLGSAAAAAGVPAVYAAPAQVIIIRHAEKPDTGNELSERGWERAYALVNFFTGNPLVTAHGTPAAIYAMKPKDDEGSLRAIETVTPLARKLNLSVDTTYLKKQHKELADDIMNNPAFEGRAVLVCWEHKVISDMVLDFGWTSFTGSWPDDTFDRAWVINFSGGRAVSFQDIPQRLLPGDSGQ